MKIPGRLSLVIASVMLLAVAFFAAALLFNSRTEQREASNFTPSPQLEAILREGKPVFVSPEFLAAMPPGHRPLVPTPDDAAAGSRQASTFWKLNRRQHYAAVLLGGAEVWREVVESLIDSPAWVLSDVTPSGYLFKPAGSPAWHLPTRQEYEQRFPDRGERARWMILTAANLAALGRQSEAEQLLAMASATKKQTSLLLSTRASLAASRGHWEEAQSLGWASLKNDRANTAASEILIRALIECGRPDEALSRARQLAISASTPSSLFLLARAADAAGSREEEIDALDRLVSAIRKRGEPLGASLTYLGQANAKTGRRGDALRAFEEALKAPELTAEQRSVVRELMDHIAVESADKVNVESGEK